MSSFLGKAITFNNLSSEAYGLRILTFDTGTSDGSGGSEPTIYQKWIINRSRVYLYGKSLNIPLQVEVTLGAENAIDAETRGAIGRWLMGKSTYLPLIIEQDDLQYVSFNIMWDTLVPKYIGNQCFSVVLRGKCDSPWAYEYPKTLTKTYNTVSGSMLEVFTYQLQSDDDNYLYPAITFHTSGNSGGADRQFNLTNHTDGSRITTFTGLSGSEIVTLDCDRGIISSSTGLKRMTLFNKKFFRLLPGNNRLTLSGSLVTFAMTVSNPKKTGA